MLLQKIDRLAGFLPFPTSLANACSFLAETTSPRPLSSKCCSRAWYTFNFVVRRSEMCLPTAVETNWSPHSRIVADRTGAFAGHDPWATDPIAAPHNVWTPIEPTSLPTIQSFPSLPELAQVAAILPSSSACFFA